MDLASFRRVSGIHPSRPNLSRKCQKMAILHGFKIEKVKSNFTLKTPQGGRGGRKTWIWPFFGVFLAFTFRGQIWPQSARKCLSDTVLKSKK